MIPDSDLERQDVVDRFFELLARTVFIENGSYKYRNVEQVVQIFNRTCEKMDVDIELYATIDESLYLRCEDSDVGKLPFVLKEFKYNYRFQHRLE